LEPLVTWVKTPEDHVIVIFGANGDLTKRKILPALFHLECEDLMPNDYRIIGNSRSEMSDEEFREFAREAVEEFGRREPSGEVFDAFAQRLSYVSHDFQAGDTEPLTVAVGKAEAELGDTVRRLLYLSVPPTAFPTITEAIGDSGLNTRARVIYEKPFGIDLGSFEELNTVVHDVLREDQVYRIDHFLGKEAVQNILALRFANGMFEPIWNRNYVDHVQIDVPETLGIGTRAGFYEQTGALRDMVVTHLFQVLGFVAMEPPSSLEPDPLMDERDKVFDVMRKLRSKDVIRGQFDGYREVEGVEADSETETYAAARVFLENWRWQGVPFYLRTGKKMTEKKSAVTLAFKSPPMRMFPDFYDPRHFDPNHLTLELGPNDGVVLAFLAKRPGPSIELGRAHMRFTYESGFGELIEAYERLIHDALIGDRTLFSRSDGVEATWKAVQGLLEDPPPLHTYEPGTWGPEAADDLIAPRRWHFPTKGSHASPPIKGES
jgi:glucose-6-phosphate 1-dehydrogenase